MPYHTEDGRNPFERDDEPAMNARQQRGHARTGYAIGDRVEIMAGSAHPMGAGLVVGYGAEKMNPNGVRIRLSQRRVETWPKSSIRLAKR